MTPSRVQLTRRVWTIVDFGHFPVIVNGWSWSRVAAYERRYFWEHMQVKVHSEDPPSRRKEEESNDAHR